MHLVCAKLQMLEEIEANRDGKLTGWSVGLMNSAPHFPEEQKQGTNSSTSNLKMQTRTRSRREAVQHMHAHVAWLN